MEDITADSRKAGPACAFAAWPGQRTDGRRYLADAAGRGAAALIWEDGDGFVPAACNVPGLGVTRLRELAGHLAHEIHGRPSESLWLAGVTGTNGKTTITQMLARALDELGERCGIVGTLGCGFPGCARGRHQHHAGCARPAPLVRALSSLPARAARRWRCRRSALDQGRVNGAAVRCRGVHQPQPGPSRLPRHHGRLRRGQGATVRPSRTAHQRHQYRRPLRAGAGAPARRRRARGDRVHAAQRQPRRGARRARAARRPAAGRTRRLAFQSRLRAGHQADVANVPHGRAVQRVEPDRRRRGLARPWRRLQQPGAGAVAPGAAAGAHAARRGCVRAARRGRLRALAGRAGQGARGAAGDGAHAWRSPGLRVRLRWRSRPGQAPDDGRDRPFARRPCGRHQRQSALGRPAAHHRGDRCRCRAAGRAGGRSCAGDRARHR